MGREFTSAVLSYPTAIFTALLCIVLVYWLLAIAGLVDFEHSGLDVDVHPQAHADPSELGALATVIVTFGLDGVPFSIAVSLVVLYGWVASCLGGMWLQPMAPDGVLGWLAGTAVFGAAGALALVLSSRTIRPLRRLFVTHSAISNAALVGQTCRVLTGAVNPRVGRAEVAQRGASLNIRVWAREPNTLTRGSAARIVDYDAERARYLIVPDA